ncbi:MAG TPA: succinate dehydrogenase, cytochrome b556 subunit [bacterium]|nr:succinate dehydrogenase, cytochrome b556 subunit [bacterium]HQG44544.1 succinate dehydrogenase, cytochrome b556 subunit [bacterium]HQI47935.1 succinate dehydrogenase, cytochrome b556 subunit [bacterium]HQJ64420.1 succinate dehydrogenase, cytochrome b556 subunit [bacterium]HQJ65532.1 succinate dehydrogenase, cytochrome b556 subunit [bacterium]
MAERANHYPNKLGLWGWLGGGRYGLERYAYALHRLTGMGILFYFVLHIFVTGSRLGGAQKWAAEMGFFENNLFKFGEYLVYAAFAYHALNGIRLGLTELGFLMGKPTRPLYPYRSAVMRQRPVLIVVMVLAAVLIIAGGVDLFE